MSGNANRIFLRHIANVIINGLPLTALFFAVLSYGFWSMEMNFWPSGGKHLQVFHKHLYYCSIKKGWELPETKSSYTFLARSFPICNTAVFILTYLLTYSMEQIPS
jgi:hypothetical protein